MLQARTWLARTEGSIRLDIARRGHRSHIDVLHQAGAARVRFPRPGEGASLEAVLINTAGGLTGGDRIDIAVALAACSEVMLTSAAAEKIYRARDQQAAAIRMRLRLLAGASLDWLPQPTILFDAARLDRRTEVELAGDSRLLAVEILLFGRAAMGEEMRRGAIRDAWRVRRDGALIFADSLRLDGAIADTLDRKALLGGARAAGLLLYVAPDAASRLAEARARLQGANSLAGASTWNGLLAVRAVAKEGRALQQDMAALVEWLSARPLPRVWRC